MTVGKKHWENLAKTLTKRLKLTSRDLVVDVGSNTGTLLSYFKKEGVRILGVDPARTLGGIARKSGVPTLTDYFTLAVSQKIIRSHGHASVITCTNVFDHVADLTEVGKAFGLLLSPTGTIVIEVPYFYRMVTGLTHIPYLQQTDYMMLTQLVPFWDNLGLVMVDAEEIPLHGGSIRFIVKHKGRGKPTKRLLRLLQRERTILRTYPSELLVFARNIRRERDTLTHYVRQAKKRHETVAAVGASAKGITLLNYAGLGPKDIDFICEKSPLKIGRTTPRGIPVVPDRMLTDAQPDCAILLSWNFAEEIMGNLKSYKGSWIIPVPKLKILS